MATKNQKTGKFEARKMFSTGHEYVGIGDTKESAKEDLAKRLKEIEIDYGPFSSKEHEQAIKARIGRGLLPKYSPPLQQALDLEGKPITFRSPGYEFKMNDGIVKYEFNQDRQVPVMTRALTTRQESELSKVRV